MTISSMGSVGEKRGGLSGHLRGKDAMLVDLRDSVGEIR